jgi:predicted lactoylglutathione lyase
MGEQAEGGAKKEAGMLIVQSKVRDLIREKEMRTSDEFINALSEHVRQAVEKAVLRAKENGRSTLRPADL